MHENEIAYSLLQTLPLNTPFDNPFSPKGVNTKDLLLEICHSDTEMAELFIRTWPLDSLITRQLYLTMQPLVLLLHDPVSHELFTKDCALARLATHHLPMGVCFLQATQAFAWASKQAIPLTAQAHLTDWAHQSVEEDPPVSYALPQYDWVKRICASDEHEDDPEAQLGVLIQKWARSKAPCQANT